MSKALIKAIALDKLNEAMQARIAADAAAVAAAAETGRLRKEAVHRYNVAECAVYLLAKPERLARVRELVANYSDGPCKTPTAMDRAIADKTGSRAAIYLDRQNGLYQAESRPGNDAVEILEYIAAIEKELP